MGARFAEGILYLNGKKEGLHRNRMAPLEYWDDRNGGEVSDGCHDDTDGELTPDDDTPVSDDSFYIPTPPPSDHDEKSPEKRIESSLLIKPLLQPEAKKVKT